MGQWSGAIRYKRGVECREFEEVSNLERKGYCALKISAYDALHGEESLPSFCLSTNLSNLALLHSCCTAAPLAVTLRQYDGVEGRREIEEVLHLLVFKHPGSGHRNRSQ